MPVNTISNVTSVAWTDLTDTSANQTTLKTDMTDGINDAGALKAKVDALTSATATYTLSQLGVNNDVFASVAEATTWLQANQSRFQLASYSIYEKTYSPFAVRAMKDGKVVYVASEAFLSWASWDENGRINGWPAVPINTYETLPAPRDFSTSFMTYTGRGWTLPASYPIQSVTNANSSVTIDEINSRLGTNYTASSALTKSQWQDVLQKYNKWIALQRSGLSVSDGGGIQFLDGKWYAGRQEVKFMDLYVAIRVNSLFNQQSATTVILNQIQKRNTRIKQANEFLSQLQAIEPTNTTDTVAKSKLGEICDAFIAKYGYNPFVAFIPVSDKGSISSGTSFKQVQFENWFTELKANISSYQTDNESDQAYLQEITNKRSETTDSISNMIKSISQNNSGVARNLA